MAERDADALGELCTNSLDAGQLPEQGGERPHVLLVISLQQLRRNRGTVLEYGGQLSAALTRMLLCDSAITPVVLGDNSEPLYVGRTKRCVTPAQRKALIARDGGCAKPGCGRRPHHCQSHHINHWAQGPRISPTCFFYATRITTRSTNPAGLFGSPMATPSSSHRDGSTAPSDHDANHHRPVATRWSETFEVPSDR